MNTIYPDCENGIISRMPDNIYGYHGWGSVCKEGGELFAVCSALRMHHICPFGKTALFRSYDEGKTWSAPIIVNDTPLDDRDAGIISLKNGQLLVTWFVHPAKLYLDRFFKDFIPKSAKDEILRAELGYWKESCLNPALGGSFLRVSNDCGFTWGETVRVPVSSPHGPVQLHNGSIVYFGKQMYSDKIKKGSLAVFGSGPDAKNWELLSYIDAPEGFNNDNCHEPHLTVLEGGRLLGSVRVQQSEPHIFTVYTCYSDDNAVSWSRLVPTGIEGSPPHLMQHSSKAVILSVGRRIPPYGERAYISRDGGESWSEEYILQNDAPNNDLGYPCSVELQDKSILTVYYQYEKGDTNASFLYSKWSL